MVENLREQRPKFEAVDREGREADRVTMDFVGLMDGAAFEGGKGEDVAVLLGGGRMLKEFELGITGIRRARAGSRGPTRPSTTTRRWPGKSPSSTSHQEGGGEAPPRARRCVLP